MPHAATISSLPEVKGANTSEQDSRNGLEQAFALFDQIGRAHV